MNVGEQIVADYLTFIKECEFVKQNTQTTDSQGEIDVIGINIKDNKVYFCEVTVHTGGLSYINRKTNKINNIDKISDKFKRIKGYADKHYESYDHCFMFWSPIVKKATKATTTYDAVQQFETIKDDLKSCKITLEVYINREFQNALEELREKASKETKNMVSPIMRLFQIENRLKKNLEKL